MPLNRRRIDGSIATTRNPGRPLASAVLRRRLLAAVARQGPPARKSSSAKRSSHARRTTTGRSARTRSPARTATSTPDGRRRRAVPRRLGQAVPDAGRGRPLVHARRPDRALLHAQPERQGPRPGRARQAKALVAYLTSLSAGSAAPPPVRARSNAVAPANIVPIAQLDAARGRMKSDEPLLLGLPRARRTGLSRKTDAASLRLRPSRTGARARTTTRPGSPASTRWRVSFVTPCRGTNRAK